MSQGQWNIVMQTNALLHGSYVRLPRHGISKKVERAMHAAFKLKPRQFYDFEASMENKDIPTPKVFLFYAYQPTVWIKFMLTGYVD